MQSDCRKARPQDTESLVWNNPVLSIIGPTATDIQVAENNNLTSAFFSRRIRHQVQPGLHNRESRENRERSRLCNQERTLQYVTARNQPCGKAQSLG